jgi:ABC-type branched-subunit amino acid transport system substrate-binding protein
MKIITSLICLLSIFTSACEAIALPIKVGVILPLSGGLAEYGSAFRNGINLAQDSSPNIAQAVNFIFEDSQYDNHRAIAAFNKLSAPKNCSLAIVWGSGPSESLAPIADKRGFPLMIIGEHTAAIGRSSVITFANPADQFARALAHTLQSRRYKKIAMVTTQITYFETLTKSLKENLSPDQELNIIGAFQPSDNDFKTTIAKLKTIKADALGIYLLNGQVSLFYKQLEEQKLRLPTFGTDIFESTTEIANSLPGIEGAFYAHNTVSADFKARYISTFASDAHLPTAARGYDFANLVANLVGSTAPTTSDEILRRIEQTGARHGASGEFEFANSPEYGRYFKFPVVIKEIKNGVTVAQPR